MSKAFLIFVLPFTLICLIPHLVDCGSDLCKNGAKIDAITYIDTKKMWFFTSGGHYWFTKVEDFPPKEAGKPLPGGFKKGDAAIFKNTLDACSPVKTDKSRPEEQEIHLIEMVNGENKILIYDTRANEWINADSPTPYNKDRGLGQAKIDWTAPIDAAFIYKKTNIAVIQGKKYSVVNIDNVCKDRNAWGEGKQGRSTTELNVVSAIDATAAFNDRYFHLFQDQVFWKVEITAFKPSEGRLYTTKNMQQDTLTEFWKFKENCELPTTPASDQTTADPDDDSVGEIASNPEPPKDESEETTPQETPEESPEERPEEKPEDSPPHQANEPETTTEGSDESGGFPWIIVVIVVIVIVLIAIVLIACLALRKSKSSDSEAAKEVTPSASATSSRAGASKVKSSLGDSPSTMSVRSNADLVGAKSGSKVGSKIRSKTSSKSGAKGMSSSLGTSPSTMSVRSNAGLGTSKISSKK